MRDLFGRRDSLAKDNVEKLKKHIEAMQSKIEGLRISQKEGWAQDVDRLSNMVERDQASVSLYLQRRVYIRYW